MTGKPKGRTVKAVKNKANALSKNPATRPMATLLSLYWDKLTVAKELRGGHAVHARPWSQLKKDLDMLKAEGVILPADLSEQLVIRQVGLCVSECKWDEYFKTLSPFTLCDDAGDEISAFDSLAPLMATMPRKPEYKIKCLIKVHYSEILSPRLYMGSETAQEVSDICTAALAFLQGQDMAMMDSCMAKACKDATCLHRSLLHLIQMPFNSEGAKEAQCLDAETLSSTTSTTAQSIIAAAVHESDWYKARLKECDTALPIMIEKEAHIRSHVGKAKAMLEKAMLEQESALMEDWIADLINAFDDLALANGKVELTTLSAELSLCKCALAQCMKLLLANTAVLAETSTAHLNRLLQAASIAIPEYTAIATWQAEIGEFASKGKTDALILKLEAVIAQRKDLDKIDFFTKARTAELQNAANLCFGLTLGSELVAAIEEVAECGLGFLCGDELEAELAMSVVTCMAELIGFTGADKATWSKLKAALKSAWALKATDAAKLSDEAYMSSYRLEINYARSAIAAITADKPSESAKETSAQVLKFVQAKHDEHDKIAKTKDTEYLDLAKEKLVASLDDARKCVGGNLSGDKSWRADVSAFGTWDDLVAAADRDNLAGLDIEKVQETLKSLAAAKVKSAQAHKMAGVIDVPDIDRDAEDILLKGTVTCVEATLMKHRDKPDVKFVQKEIKKIRACKISNADGTEGRAKEKDVFAIAFYEWALKQIVGD